MKKNGGSGFDSFSLPRRDECENGNDNLLSLEFSRELEEITARFPFIRKGIYGKSVMGKNLEYIIIGKGKNRVLYNGAHHGNEWITASVLLRFARDFARALCEGGEISGVGAGRLYERAEIYIAPVVNPDGVDIASGTLSRGAFCDMARVMAGNRPDLPFPSGWKANALGVDPNLQYPAGWRAAKKIKSAQGVLLPGPRDFAGERPLEAPESRALWRLTKKLSPCLTLSFHSQGEVIYWKYCDIEVPGAASLAMLFESLSGYEAQEVPPASGFAGYKDWFIKEFRRPGFTIEVGLGESPLPQEQLGKIYSDTAGIMVHAALEAPGR